MKTFDLAIIETGNGGDIQQKGNDLAIVNGVENMIYLAMFGGNVEASTTAVITQSQSFDFWGNTVFASNSPSQQFNSETERTIRTIALNSSGRLALIQAVEQDLNYLKSVADITIEVEIIGSSQTRIIVTFSEKTNQQDKLLQLVYDNAKGEVIIEKII